MMCGEQWNEHIQFGPKCYLLASRVRQKCDNFQDFKEDGEWQYPIFLMVFLLYFGSIKPLHFATFTCFHLDMLFFIVTRF